MKRLVAVTAVLLSMFSIVGAKDEPADVPKAVLDAQDRRIAVMDTAKDAVLAVFSSSGRGGGSGVVISPDGFALTNFHVTKPCGNAMKCGMADGKLYDAVIVGLDPTGDVALIKLLGRDDFPYAELGDSDQCRQGDWVFAMGNPFLLATDFRPTTTYGILSGVHRYQYPAGTLLEYADCLQTDAAVNPGNSGGPLFDARGQLIGINGRCSFEKRGRVSVGVGYAISINQIKNFLGYLHSGRIVDHATLGAVVQTDDEGRVVVADILEGSDAFRRGLRYDDEIVRFAGRPIATTNAFKNALGIFPKGWRVPLSFRRQGKRYDVLVRLQGVHRQRELIEKVKPRARPARPKPVPKPGDDPSPDDAPDKRPRSKPKPEPKAPDPGKIPRPKDHPFKIPPTRRPPVPEVVKKYFQAKPGYANYYFNRLHQDRVFGAWRERGDFGSLGGRWTIAGQARGERAVRFELDDAGVLLKLPGGEVKWTATEELGESLEPSHSGGLLLALHLWRRLAVEGPGKFGQVYYLGTALLGTAPTAGRRQPLDVLVGLYGGVECRFFFDPVDHDLVAVEMFPDDNVDPCEVYFAEYRRLEGRMVPRRMEVRHGDELFGDFQLESFQFE